MASFGGFGPTSGRLVQKCESSEGRFRWARRPGSAAGAVAFVALFLGVVSGTTLIHDGQELLGLMVLTAPFVLTALMVVWVVRTRK